MKNKEKEGYKKIVKKVYRHAKDIYFQDIEIFDSSNKWAQGKYLVHGNEGSYWVETIKEVLCIIKYDLELIEKFKIKEM